MLEKPRSVAFVCDASGSMLSKMPVLRGELRQAVMGLQPMQAFNVLFTRCRASPQGRNINERYNVTVITRQSIQTQREAILEIASRYGASDIRIFGSVARGDSTDSSDLDLIVRFEPGRSLLDHGGLVMDLRELLGSRVDVIDEEAMRPRFRQNVMKEAIPL
jgi:predicted nucleotidyltransferase